MADPGCWKHQHIEHARRSLVTREAQARMAGKTARQQLADALDATNPDLFVARFGLAKLARYEQIVSRDRSQGKFLLGWVRRVLHGSAA